MAYQIIAVRLDFEFYKTEDHITEVKLYDGTIETVPQVVKYIDSNYRYYFTSSNRNEVDVEAVHPNSGAAYIRTKPNNTTRDNLLSLPRF